MDDALPFLHMADARSEKGKQKPNKNIILTDILLGTRKKNPVHPACSRPLLYAPQLPVGLSKQLTAKTHMATTATLQKCSSASRKFTGLKFWERHNCTSLTAVRGKQIRPARHSSCWCNERRWGSYKDYNTDARQPPLEAAVCITEMACAVGEFNELKIFNQCTGL